MSIRLINTSSYRLRVFSGNATPKYAILSHTWVQDDEVSFQEMTALVEDPCHPARKKSGFCKAINTCEKAKSHGIAFAWVDTCCIDKTSSAELSEAINSMFKWYQVSEVCYALLSDLEPNATANLGSTLFEPAMSHCRWFTRGWCLQELIAPNELRFYDSHWSYVGSKFDLSRLIAEITSIDEDILTDCSLLQTVPVARRMSWAATRSTTRVEDTAYCLLGIFNVNMPMLYGEGPKAFMRLQEEIIRYSSDLSIFCSSIRKDELCCEGEDQLNLADYSVYRNLFAQSPAAFSDCGELRYEATKVLPRRTFALTNSGLHFPDAELMVDPKTGCYRLPLDCSVVEFLSCQMLLRKVGAGLFARVRKPLGTGDIEDMTNVTEDVYVIQSVPKSLRKQICSSHDFAIQISSNAENLGDALQDAVPPNQWDAPALQFLTFGDETFEGYVKVFPDMALLGYGPGGTRIEEYSDHFYLAVGLEIGARYDAWLRLFSKKEWENLKRKVGRMVGLKYLGLDLKRRTMHADFTRGDLKFGSKTVVARMRRTNHPTEQTPLFLLEIGFDIVKERN